MNEKDREQIKLDGEEIAVSLRQLEQFSNVVMAFVLADGVRLYECICAVCGNLVYLTENEARAFEHSRTEFQEYGFRMVREMDREPMKLDVQDAENIAVSLSQLEQFSSVSFAFMMLEFIPYYECICAVCGNTVYLTEEDARAFKHPTTECKKHEYEIQSEEYREKLRQDVINGVAPQNEGLADVQFAFVRRDDLICYTAKCKTCSRKLYLRKEEILAFKHSEEYCKEYSLEG